MGVSKRALINLTMNIYILILSTLLISCNSSKLKIYNIHSVKSPLFSKNNNFYKKDSNRSFESIRGTWEFSQKKDTLILKIKPFYKKEMDSLIFNCKKCFYDGAIANIKYIKDNKVIVDNLTNKNYEALEITNFDVYIDYFHVSKHNESGILSTLYLLTPNELQLTSRYVENLKSLIYHEEKDIVEFPKSFIMKRLSY